MSSEAVWVPDVRAADRRWRVYLLGAVAIVPLSVVMTASEGWGMTLTVTILMVGTLLASGYFNVRWWRRALRDAELHLIGTTLHFGVRGVSRSIDLSGCEVMRFREGDPKPEYREWPTWTEVTVSRDRKWGPDETIVRAFITGKSLESLEQFLADACHAAGLAFERSD